MVHIGRRIGPVTVCAVSLWIWLAPPDDLLSGECLYISLRTGCCSLSERWAGLAVLYVPFFPSHSFHPFISSSLLPSSQACGNGLLECVSFSSRISSVASLAVCFGATGSKTGSDAYPTWLSSFLLYFPFLFSYSDANIDHIKTRTRRSIS